MLFSLSLFGFGVTQLYFPSPFPHHCGAFFCPMPLFRKHKRFRRGKGLTGLPSFLSHTHTNTHTRKHTQYKGKEYQNVIVVAHPLNPPTDSALRIPPSRPLSFPSVSCRDPSNGAPDCNLIALSPYIIDCFFGRGGSSHPITPRVRAHTYPPMSRVVATPPFIYHSFHSTSKTKPTRGGVINRGLGRHAFALV